MNKKDFIVCDVARTPLCNLNDNTPNCVRSIKESLSVNEITSLTFEIPVVPNGKWLNIVNENLILFNKEYYKIKSMDFTHDQDGKLALSVEAKHYSDTLATNTISLSETTPLNVIDLMKLALCYEDDKPTLGWKVGKVTVDRTLMRGLEAVEQSPFSILLTIADKYDGILKFNSMDMTVDMLERQPIDRPELDLRVSKNLKSFNITYDTSEMYTRLYCYGATDDNGNELDITSVHPESKPYVENFDYFKRLGYDENFIEAHKELFVSTNIWKEDTFVDANDLYQEGLKQVAKTAQPTVEVKIQALDTKAMNLNGDITKLELGSCVKIKDEDLGTDILCNVTKRTIDYDNPHILTCEVTSSVTYHDTLSQLFTNVTNASNIVTSGGNLVGGQGTTMDNVKDYLNLNYLNASQIEAKYVTSIDLKTYYLTAEDIRTNYLDADAIGAKYATIANLNAVEAKIKDLDVDSINAKFGQYEDLFAQNAEFHKLVATDAEINDLKANNLTVMGKLSADKAEVDKVLANKVSTNDFETYKATIEKLFATYATIEYLETNYITAKQIEGNYAKITELDATNANITTLKTDLATVQELVGKKASIEDLNAANAKIDTLNTDVANINKVMANKVEADYVQAEIAKTNKVITDDLKAIHAVVDTLDTKYATIEQLNVAKANLEDLIAKKASIDDLNAAKADIGSLNTLVANINSILAGNIGTGTLQTIHLTANNVVIDDAIIKSANIEGLDVSKLNAGTISTDKFTIQSDSGGIIITGSTQQFKDKNGKVRLQVGQDAKGNFNFIVFGEDGTTAIYNENGITKNAVPDGLIVDQMVADNANIQASKVQYIDKDGNKTLQTVIEQEQGKITSLIKETETIKGDVTTLSDKYNETVKTVEGNTTTIANIKTSVDTNTKNISSMDSRITEIKQTADGVSTTVTNNKSKWDKASTDASSALTKATQNADKFSWLVKSGTNSTDFTLTDRTAELVAENINLNGRVTFKGLSSDAQTKISNAESNASSALSTAKTANSTASTASTNASSALEKANTASSNASSALTKASNAETNASNALSKANSATTTANTANSTANTAKTTADSAVNLVRSTVTSLANGKLLYKDVKFDQGVNKINLYNNSGNGNVTITRQAKSSDNPCGNYELLIKNVGTSSPSCGGFAWSNKSRANAVFVYRIIAKIPTGRNIIWAANAFGSGANAQWLTSQNGTGKFTEYVLKATCGATGSFSSIGYFYINGSVGTTDNPVTWNVAYAGCWDMTDYEDKANQSIIDNWAKDSIVNGETVINGGYIKTNTIETDQLAVDSIFAKGSTVMNIINAQEIDATRITTGQLEANRLNVYGLTVINKTSNQQTFNVSPNGEVTMRGSVSSYDYHNGKTGWTINSDGSAEFNNVDVRGSVITNDGGIASSGGSGENLLLNSSLESNLDGWVNNSGYATTTLDGYNCTKVSGSLTTTKLLQQSITLKIKKDTTSIYTISGWVKLVNYKAGSTNPFCSLYFQGAYNNNGTSTWLGSTGISGNGSIIPQNNKGWQYITYTFRFAQIPTYMNFCVYARDFTGDLYVRDLKLEEGDIATPWSAAKDDKIKQVRFWAGATYEERENAPFVVYNDGWVKATQGEFSGIWTGDIKIGNISIVDPSASSGNDALLTIQNGDSGIKSIQLTDGNSSTFAQDLIISTNTSAYTPMITLKTDGTAVFNRGINIANSVTLNGSSLLMNNKELTTTSTGFLMNGSLDVGSTGQTSNLIVHGSTTSDEIVVNNELRFGSVIKFTKMSNGINIDFIE